jgi:hypothetical protein
MKTIFAACLLMLPIATACVPNTTTDSLKPSFKQRGTKRPLTKVHLDYPNVTFKFLSTNEEHKSGDVFAPPKTIDCSKLTLTPDAFEDAIKAGALIVDIQTPPEVKRIFKNEYGQTTTEAVPIRPRYGGVLALCKVSDRAKGPDSRIYRIRSLDDRLISGRDGNISVIGAELRYGKKTQSDRIGDRIEDRVGDSIEDRIGDMLGGFSKMVSDNRDLISNKNAPSADYSWMLWLTDRTTTFTNYEAELARSKAKKGKK